jgi:WD40 repeat protein
MIQKTKCLFDPNPLHILKKHTAAVLNVVFTKNGSHCISTSQDKSLILWNPLKNLPIKQYTGPHNHQVVDVSIASSNAFFISVGGDKAAFHWDVTTGNVIRKFTGHDGMFSLLYPTRTKKKRTTPQLIPYINLFTRVQKVEW